MAGWDCEIRLSESLLLPLLPLSPGIIPVLSNTCMSFRTAAKLSARGQRLYSWKVHRRKNQGFWLSFC